MTLSVAVGSYLGLYVAGYLGLYVETIANLAVYINIIKSDVDYSIDPNMLHLSIVSLVTTF